VQVLARGLDIKSFLSRCSCQMACESAQWFKHGAGVGLWPAICYGHVLRRNV